jgi:hypothetical protein
MSTLAWWAFWALVCLAFWLVLALVVVEVAR